MNLEVSNLQIFQLRNFKCLATEFGNQSLHGKSSVYMVYFIIILLIQSCLGPDSETPLYIFEIHSKQYKHHPQHNVNMGYSKRVQATCICICILPFFV